MKDFLIARQEIFNRNLEISAYEILFRGKDFDLSQDNQASKATHQVITDTILEIGINRLVGSHKAFINFTTGNILDKTPLALPKDRIVIEILENTVIDKKIIENLQELSASGYTIALDDFIFLPEWEPLVKLADIIKLDVLAMDTHELNLTIDRLSSYKAELLAEKIETRQQFEMLRDRGCHYFQGFFLSKPNIVEGKRLGIGQTALIKLLAAINKPDMVFDEVSRIISQDATLSFKLLHYINSAFFAIPNKISSIKQAISYLGMIEIKRWTNIIALSSLSNKPKAIIQTTLIRGKMCELIAQYLGKDTEMFFLMGMFSNLDNLMDIPIEEALAQLPLNREVSQAILNHEGFGGEVLLYVKSYEQGLPHLHTFQNLEAHIINSAFLDSITWAQSTLDNLS
ncbi:HDOD domain-containing protein [Methylicorpusculum oleiharenae]|uniref:EAL and HDOD domain-containing protein n=1 Tax=Methylicorpusculum oleiharenae TaxID=1338687 RepID=UPI0013575CEE|nr:HDOD domain-containing protein [Methylicorpusculum oleiharenae]MCD2453047.1 HDOD domain-containing protein [Methylicorpusculum oleiharenae]